ncbi:DUF5675 family protein [Algibacter mikhailovii]|uniref:DUF5675 family protein n=1 Tax=Algibacter mikhailovii TaxID=425498 RepID=UPI00249520F6|nr:DUF5675 family protein [Algibacter mikhailovii]
MELTLIRSYFKEGTNGTLFLSNKFFGFIIELPWKDNQKEVSCIPEGTYVFEPRFSDKFGHHLIVKGVPNRSLILIHVANDAQKELKGCLAPVTQLTGIGRGRFSKALFVKLISNCYQAFERKETIFLTIKSTL